MRKIVPYLYQFKEIVQGSYPGWIWQRSPKQITDHIPVFTFHAVKAGPFEAQLRFLRQNGYHTVTCSDVLAFVQGGRQLSGKEVLLTFDDGQNTVWQTAFPLLKRYGFCATVFVVPSIMTDYTPNRPTLEDVWKGRLTLDALESAPPSPLSWREIRSMLAEGNIEFQSHSLTHQRIPTGPAIADFVHPDMIRDHYFRFLLPWMPELHSVEDYTKLLGSPVYESAPALSGVRRFLTCGELQESCMELIRKCSPEQFFAQAGWKQLLMTHARYYRKEHPKKPEFESDEAREHRIAHEVTRAREILMSKLPDTDLVHMAFPWGAGSDLAVECCRKAGYQSCFWSTIAGNACNKPGSDPFFLVRLKHDFIWRLPEVGRRSLREIFLTKLNRRKKGETAY